MKGITIQLVNASKTDTDPFGAPIEGNETLEDINDVLVGGPSSDDVATAISLYDKKITYIIAIPKGDTHDWINREVILPKPFEGRYRTVGIPMSGIEANIPLRWNSKVKLERIEDGTDKN